MGYYAITSQKGGKANDLILIFNFEKSIYYSVTVPFIRKSSLAEIIYSYYEKERKKEKEMKKRKKERERSVTKKGGQKSLT